MIEIRVIGEDAEAIRKDIAVLAEAFGVVTGEVNIEAGSGETLVGSATAEKPKQRGRKTNAQKAAETLSSPQEPPPAPAEPADDPFGGDDEEEETVDLEALKKATLERLQKLSAEKGGMDTVNSLLSKHGKGERKFSKLSLETFPAIARDLDTLKA